MTCGSKPPIPPKCLLPQTPLESGLRKQSQRKEEKMKLGIVLFEDNPIADEYDKAGRYYPKYNNFVPTVSSMHNVMMEANKKDWEYKKKIVRECKGKNCTNTFKPSINNHIFCSKKCQLISWRKKDA